MQEKKIKRIILSTICTFIFISNFMSSILNLQYNIPYETYFLSVYFILSSISILFMIVNIYQLYKIITAKQKIICTIMFALTMISYVLVVLLYISHYLIQFKIIFQRMNISIMYLSNITFFFTFIDVILALSFNKKRK